MSPHSRWELLKSIACPDAECAGAMAHSFDPWTSGVARLNRASSFAGLMANHTLPLLN
jgi:hypothetical protein